MNETDWLPIETAPTDEKVLCGGWEIYGDRKEWKTSDGRAWERYFFGLLRRPSYHGREFSHWKPLPPPPASIVATP
jgi:hypothetical protein